MSHALDIIIPTYNNFEYLRPCLESILRNKTSQGLFHIYVVNNGHESSCDWVHHQDITVFNAGSNLRWEGALEYALAKTSAPYVMFLNDDVLIPPVSMMWINQMLQHFISDEVGAVGPSSNVVMGLQNIFNLTDLNVFTAKYLIGFCFITRRKAIIEAGGIDPSLPGGDDLDMSIRLRDKGKQARVWASPLVCKSAGHLRAGYQNDCPPITTYYLVNTTSLLHYYVGITSSLL